MINQEEKAGVELLYITFTDFGDVSSGSGVRPFKMYNAFEKCDITVKLLEGQQNRRRDRRNKVKEISDWLDNNKPDLCYIEPPSGPWFNIADLRLLKKISDMNIPIGLFYRDAYWKFPKWADLKGIKGKLIIAMQKRDMRFFEKYCDIMYFPSQEAAEVFPEMSFKHVKLLPPGAEPPNQYDDSIKRTLFYVGNVLEADGIDDLLIALDELNKEGMNIKFILVTRWNELGSMREQTLLKKEWLQIEKGSGEYLNQFYEQADLGVLVKKRHFYMDKAVSVKIYEYMAHSLPILSTDCPVAKRIVESENCGIICQDNKDSIKKAIKEYYSDDGKIKELRWNAYEAALNNTWEQRAKQVLKDGLEIKR